MFINRWKIIKEVEEKKLENLQNDLEKLREKQHKLSALSIAEVLRDYSVDEVFSEKVQTNKLIVFLLPRGYIDEKYVNYINYFKGTSITKDDMNFILSIKNSGDRDKKSEAQSLTKGLSDLLEPFKSNRKYGNCTMNDEREEAK